MLLVEAEASRALGVAAPFDVGVVANVGVPPDVVATTNIAAPIDNATRADVDDNVVGPPALIAPLASSTEEVSIVAAEASILVPPLLLVPLDSTVANEASIPNVVSMEAEMPLDLRSTPKTQLTPYRWRVYLTTMALSLDPTTMMSSQ